MGDDSILFCVDSGTTSVKAAAFTRDGRLLAVEETPNHALRRHSGPQSDRVEQDMAVTRDDAFAVLQRCVARVRATPAALIVTGQGDGSWLLDHDAAPCGLAITWLDGRARGLLAEFARDGTLDAAAGLLRTRLTTASQSVQLAWLARNEPERFVRIGHALRCKEFLFHAFTNCILGEPGSLIAAWGDPLTLALQPAIATLLGLSRGVELLPEIVPLRDSVRGLTAIAAARIGLPAGLPVMLGPGDVQATAIGLGIGVRGDMRRASVFGTSAIHLGLLDDVRDLQPEPPGALLQPFVEPGRTLYLHPGFNGTVAFAQAERLLGLEPQVQPAWSGVVLHPFFEPGGERAPVTNPFARAALFGMNATTDRAELAWAARESLAFVARISHDAIARAQGTDDNDPIALGGGLAADTDFARFLATVLDRPVQRATTAHAGLAGLGLVAASVLSGRTLAEQAADWDMPPLETIPPASGALAAYARKKCALFRELLDVVKPFWETSAQLADEAAALRDGAARIRRVRAFGLGDMTARSAARPSAPLSTG